MEQRTFSDVTFPAYFDASGKSFTITPQRNESGIVEFVVQGDGIDAALNELYSNASVGALDFVRALKVFRSSIFALKGLPR